MKVEIKNLLDHVAGTLRTEQPKTPNDVDARHVALETLRTYLSRCNFARTGASGTDQVEVFRVPYDSIFTEQPDSIVDLPMPALTFVAGEGVHEPYGLGPPQLIEETADQYGKGLVLVALAEYVEEFNLETWSEYRAERRALVAGLLEAFTPLEETWSLRLKLPDYFDQVANFEFKSTRLVEDLSDKNRRRSQIRVQLRVPEVALVRYVRLERVLADVEVIDRQVEALAELQTTLATYYAPQT